ncbi:hypothetical protein PIROE2DRAFT_16237, partial [Piromyces sp. E2]
MILNTILLSLLLFSSIHIINAVTIKAIAYTYTEEIHIYTPLVNKFNNFSNENKLNITLELIVFTPMNSSANVDDFESAIETILNKNPDKYDIYFYDNIYSKKFGTYLIDLKEELPEEHINEYNPNFLSQACSCNNKIVGLPVSLDYSVLYSNSKLLDKYNKTIPKTWDELITTSQYITENEKIT